MSAALALAVATLAVATVTEAGPYKPAPAPSAAPSALPKPIAYVPISPKVFVSPAVVAKWAKHHNEAAVAAHAAALWAGLTAPTKQRYHGVKLATFDTWFTPCDVYPAPQQGQPPCHSVISQDPANPDVPHQFVHNDTGVGPDVFASVRYNKEMADFAGSTYGGGTYASGAGLVNAINAKLTNLPDTVKPSAMMLKPSYQLVSTKHPTLIHVWSGPGLSVAGTTSPDAPGTTTWTKVVLVDPTGTATNTTDRTFCVDHIGPTDANDVPTAHENIVAKAGTYSVVPLSEFYYVPLETKTVQRLKAERSSLRVRAAALSAKRLGAQPTAAPTPGNGPCPDTGVDDANTAEALVAMHVTSAEYDQVWTWQTFWFQPNRTQGLPGSSGPFSHFDVATAYWTIDKPPYGFRFAFNPYTEASFNTTTFNNTIYPAGAHGVLNLGRTTNCISCHSQATYTIPAQPAVGPGYVAHGDEPQIPTTQSIKTLNLWSMAGRAGHPTPTPTAGPSSSPAH